MCRGVTGRRGVVAAWCRGVSPIVLCWLTHRWRLPLRPSPIASHTHFLELVTRVSPRFLCGLSVPCCTVHSAPASYRVICLPVQSVQQLVCVCLHSSLASTVGHGRHRSCWRHGPIAPSPCPLSTHVPGLSPSDPLRSDRDVIPSTPLLHP